MHGITVTGLAIYPVKSCAAIDVQEARVTPRGLELDRDFMLVADDGHFMSQRRVPELALIVPRIGETSITLTAPGIERVEIPLELEHRDEDLVAATVHEKPVVGQLVSEELNDWFTTFLPRYRQNTRFRLLRVRDDAPRYVAERYHKPAASNQLGFADGSAMLLASERSLAALNTEMDEPAPMNRFRPNIVIDGERLAPYDEDFWEELQIGSLEAFVVKASDRCVIPDVDQRTAVTGKAVRRALMSRKGVNAHDESNTGVFFAQNLNHVYAPGASVKVGDPVRVLSRSAQPNVVLRKR
ncbi:MAG TPA: MOSC N-terminal beta barrel domain-containing protein [Solirubrobacteraceae bacterium]|nr:MOSC N-terminal beta barrel domain-containing protein [Solirubrobacteraceae bacterium]